MPKDNEIYQKQIPFFFSFCLKNAKLTEALSKQYLFFLFPQTKPQCSPKIRARASAELRHSAPIITFSQRKIHSARDPRWSPRKKAATPIRRPPKCVGDIERPRPAPRILRATTQMRRARGTVPSGELWTQVANTIPPDLDLLKLPREQKAGRSIHLAHGNGIPKQSPRPTCNLPARQKRAPGPRTLQPGQITPD